MAKKNIKEQIINPITISNTIEGTDVSKDVIYTYIIPSNVVINSISCNAYIEPIGLDASIISFIKFNNKVISQGKVIITSKGTGWSSCKFENESGLENGVISLVSSGSNFKKGLKFTIKGYERIDV